MKCLIMLAAAACLAAGTAIAAQPESAKPTVETQVYAGMCDASAGVFLDREHFVVADDELNVLRIYREGVHKEVGSVDAAKFLDTKPDKESDLEGAAVIGSRIYWISSHGLNKKAEFQERRHRLFATDINAGSPPSVGLKGRAYTDLQEDLWNATALASLGLSEAAERAPEAPGGFNIEGLAATPDGRLLVAFRNPVPDGKAIIIPIENPAELVKESSTARAKLGAPIRLNLDKRGIRSIELVGKEYLIVAGPTADDGTFALYSWSGQPSQDAKALVTHLPEDLNPEALLAVPGTPRVLLLSDDGGVTDSNGKACKDIRPKEQQTFRALPVPL